jgi:hypothetical protein
VPEAASEFLHYAIRTTTASKEARSRLSAPLQQELRRIIDEFAQDPDRFSERSRPYGGKGFVYTHPEPPLEITYELDRENKVVTFIDFALREFVGKLVIISYSHEDSKFLRELKKFLRPLQKRKQIRIWDDTEIEAGDRWRREIRRFMQSADAAIFLVSQDFIDSDFIADHELPALLEAAKQGRVRIFWIAVRPSTYKQDLALEIHQAINDPERPLSKLDKSSREEEFTAIREKIENALDLG